MKKSYERLRLANNKGKKIKLNIWKWKGNTFVASPWGLIFYIVLNSEISLSKFTLRFNP